jgi:hypothetical protein
MSFVNAVVQSEFRQAWTWGMMALEADGPGRSHAVLEQLVDPFPFRPVFLPPNCLPPRLSPFRFYD